MSVSGGAQLVLGVVTCRWGALMIHRSGQDPPAFFPGGPPLAGEQPSHTAERTVLEDARLRVRAGKVIGRHPHPTHRRTVVYVAATPRGHITEDDLSTSVHMGWYTLDQIELLLPDLHPPVREHLEARIPQR